MSILAGRLPKEFLNPQPPLDTTLDVALPTRGQDLAPPTSGQGQASPTRNPTQISKLPSNTKRQVPEARKI